ncbi:MULTISPECIES: polysaccharide biosynthesis/export family protein [Rhodopirellula]|jgi:protein involved in polysaccharide export with SLBB domain|uniref:Polysaccharide export protein n=1 Tax=Rhodopirellula europaea SH398 TaxID=1263868 RepID=M5SQB0_9BACT|nr:MULTISPECIES: SLBB domain-containing protein [Rhodopirellula]EMI28434.1 polysaccharide export protein [Rhodopirellula europaea SH398]|tara:strand:- start:1561 stop:2682 length:1122 start_codon:yes stop_codon:yes gene_type:complete
MSCSGHQILFTLGCLLAMTSTGCSTLGLSLYPSGATLTSEAKEVLNASRIPGGIARENAKQVLPARALQPGDALLIEPINLERDLRLPADQVVLADGTLDLGPYGRVIVAGRDLEQAESLIEQQIAYQIRQQESDCKQFANEQAASEKGSESNRPEPLPEDCDAIAVNVRLLEPVDRFYVLGEVNAPGAYPLSGSETVLDAIVSAGGLTSSANPCQILLARPTDPCECRVTLPVCYREIVQMGNTATNYQIQPGDRVFVASRSCLDELMFWRGSRPCERCSGCNRACRNPEYVTAKPMALVHDAMIPPGSVGWMRLANERSQVGGIVEPDNIPADQDAGLSDYLNTQDAQSNRGGPTSDADVDGELEFAPLSQ